MYLMNCKIEVEDSVVIITGPCIVTGQPYKVTCSIEEFESYYNGALIQDAFPNMSADDREFLISGYSDIGWDMVFGAEDEQE